MPEFKVGSLKELTRLLDKHQRERQKRIQTNIYRRAARRGVGVVKRRVPVAFGELRESVEAQPLEPGGARIVAEAPHAEAVELGSRPHWVPLEALIKWVKLRGMQGLASDRQLSRLPGSSTRVSARNVAAQFRSLESSGHLGVDAPEKIAKAIQLAIAHRGTRPHHYMRGAEPDILRILDEEIRAALPEPSSSQ